MGGRKARERVLKVAERQQHVSRSKIRVNGDVVSTKQFCSTWVGGGKISHGTGEETERRRAKATTTTTFGLKTRFPKEERNEMKCNSHRNRNTQSRNLGGEVRPWRRDGPAARRVVRKLNQISEVGK